MTSVHNEKRIKKSELLQLILLDNLYAQSGSHRIVFQGGTALRWVYGGMRFSEDLDFVTDLPRSDVQAILAVTFRKTQSACIAQFGPGRSEHRSKGARKQTTKVFFIYRLPDKAFGCVIGRGCTNRYYPLPAAFPKTLSESLYYPQPQSGRERIAVKLEFEALKTGRQPQLSKFVLRDLPLVAGLIAKGELIIPYSSSIILAETTEEILSDKVRALYERKYLKGRDIYDIWWLTKQLKVSTSWPKVREKLDMYEVPFIPAREADYFQKRESVSAMIEALSRDLIRFLPQDIISLYKETEFRDFVSATDEITSDLSAQGMRDYLGRR